MTEYKAFRVELADKIARVVINRPEKINAMDAAFWTEIIDIFNWVDATDDVRVVVLSGAGEHFSSGIDLQLLASVGSQLGSDVGRNAEQLRRKILSLQASFNAVDNCRKPVLAAIQGYCLGGAIDLISACDMRYSTVDAKFSIMEGVLELARDIASKSPIAIRGTKEMIRYMRDHRVDDGLEYIATWNAAMLQSADIKVAIAAHMSKQKPDFAD